ERFPLFKKWGKVHSEFEMLKKDGTQIIAAFDGRIGHTLSGEFKQTHCVLSDITEQRIKELELKESYEFNNSLLKTIPFGIDIVDKEGNILFQNENFKKYFGTDAIGMKCWEIYRDNKTQCENCPLKNKIKIGVTEVCESPGIHQSKTFEISHTGMMFKGEKAMLEIFQDVTERKRTELIQKVLYSISYAVITTKDLEEFSTFIMKQLSLLIDTTNFRIVSYDEDTDMLISQYYSDQKEELTSWSAGNTLTGYLIKQDRSLILKKEEVYELIRRGEVGPKGTPCEIWLGVPLREEGKVIGAFVLQNYEDANAYSAKDLEMLEFISTQISISIQRKKALQDLMKALEKAEESDKLKTAFLSNMSHEIRSPMNGILGFSELLYDEDLSIEERRKFLDIINTNGQHLLSIINDILDFARIDSNQLTVSKKPFDLHPLLDDLLVSYENSKITIGKAQIKFLLEKEPGGDKRMIISDEVRLRQILFNLLSNALKFTTNGFIKFGYTLSDNKLKFFVQDTGKGISKENQSIVFERFRQEEESYTRQFGGTGLGLSISKKLVELLGGEMWLVSTQGIGTTFYFTIPYTVSLKSREHENDFSVSNVSN
ncbi:MAG: ATP-binding protein, partial [Bacteroidota bacterium]|nr:ATP-binding protein [Bacteroidota bacterium]